MSKATAESVARMIQGLVADRYHNLDIVDFQRVKVDDDKARFELRVGDKVFWVNIEEGF